MQLVHVDGVLHGLSLGHRGFLEFSASAHFLDDAGFLSFSLELLESSLNAGKPSFHFIRMPFSQRIAKLLLFSEITKKKSDFFVLGENKDGNMATNCQITAFLFLVFVLSL